MPPPDLGQIPDSTCAMEVQELRRELQHGTPVLFDVRESSERALAYIEGSVHLPLALAAARIHAIVPGRDSNIVMYCAEGPRAEKACRLVRELGYTRARWLAGGLEAWVKSDYPVVRDPGTGGPEGSARYARQVRIPEIGLEGQKRLLASRVLIVGAGGLGAPASLYLAAVGVGKLGVVDYDRVEVSNLHRQILYDTTDVGASKVAQAEKHLQALNPDVKVVTHSERLNRTNAVGIVGDYDLVIDGTDNFATRYLVNDVCLLLRKANIHGSVYRFEGQVTVFCAEGGPCYRCIHPEPPPRHLVPACADAGVLGLLPGVIGTLQATEAVKLIMGLGEPLVGRLLRYDALAARFDSFLVARRSGCPWCDPALEFPGLSDYDSLCSSS